ncbi:hypothetical protein NDI49_08500 [Trichocoleus sp. ST-U3]|uniref:hypothetical protein n=1 Tax=Coleofasciculus sp. FACHB-542 TaxID=2692787 RepID=UPI0016823289|nr:hypothetical protein [Coleofasciculus sp. FACHB-542]MBD2087582.1 hypothetical protein [Coleofasciculus sp. FACHB-542]
MSSELAIASSTLVNLEISLVEPLFSTEHPEVFPPFTLLLRSLFKDFCERTSQPKWLKALRKLPLQLAIAVISCEFTCQTD